MNIQPQTQRDAPSASGSDDANRRGQSHSETNDKKTAAGRVTCADEREELDSVVWLSMN